MPTFVEIPFMSLSAVCSPLMQWKMPSTTPGRPSGLWLMSTAKEGRYADDHDARESCDKVFINLKLKYSRSQNRLWVLGHFHSDHAYLSEWGLVEVT